jgi:hypothetical protein
MNIGTRRNFIIDGYIFVEVRFECNIEFRSDGKVFIKENIVFPLNCVSVNAGYLIVLVM